MSDKEILKIEQPSIKSALLEIVQRKDIDPERLEKFINLQIKMEDRQSEKSFNEALSRFQGECPIITKHKKVSFVAASGKTTKYDYAPLDEVIYTIKPILAKNRLSYSFDIDPVNETKYRLITTIFHTEGFSKQYSHFFNPLHDDMKMNTSQRSKSAISYAKRCGIENALGIVTQDEDDDAIREYDEGSQERQITSKELDNLEKLCALVEDGENKVLTFVKSLHNNKINIEKLEDLTEVDYLKCVDQLTRKINQGVK